jgi:apolipoprotein N-acyltransferase
MNRPLEAAAPQSMALPARAQVGVGGGFDWLLALSWGIAATVSFHVALMVPALSGLMVLFLFSLLQLTGMRTARHAFRCGVVVGFAVYAPHLAFFWSIFSWAAVALWGVIAFWLGLFVVLARAVRRRWGSVPAAVLVPFVWTGLEYFRSELYYLRFSWLSASFAVSDTPQLFRLTGLGFYGVGFLLAVVAAGASALPRKGATVLLAGTIAALGVLHSGPTGQGQAGGRTLKVAGVQLEFPVSLEVPAALDRARRAHPEAELFVLSEYTFLEPIPERVKAWCRTNRCHLIAGSKEPASGTNFFNTACVVGPEGEIVFHQAKSVPIQFFQDGLPAPERKVWDSPWGRIGICVCYDLSYRRVVDDLIAQGAQGLIVPTMDMADWGKAQHRLHGRVAPIRAAEYGVPIFRVCSSGISQLVDAAGSVRAMAPFPGQGATIGGTLQLGNSGRLPLDPYLGPAASGVTVGLVVILLVGALKRRAPGRSIQPRGHRPVGDNLPREVTPHASPHPAPRRSGVLEERRQFPPIMMAALCRGAATSGFMEGVPAGRVRGLLLVPQSRRRSILQRSD